jgi:cytochrome c-type biogenesis protein CcmH/NrfG
MASETKAEPDTVPRNTMLLVAFIALGVGFLGGVVFSAFKTGSGNSPRIPAPAPVPQQQQAAQEQRLTEDQAKRILALEKEVTANPSSAEAWSQLGNLYFDTDNYESAIKAYEKSLALNPNNANVQTDLGVMYRRNGHPEEAVKAFDKAIEIDPTHEVSRFNKGIVMLHDLNDQEGAIAAWEGLVKINPAAMTPSGQPLSEMLKRFKSAKKP